MKGRRLCTLVISRKGRKRGHTSSLLQAKCAMIRLVESTEAVLLVMGDGESSKRMDKVIFLHGQTLFHNFFKIEMLCEKFQKIKAFFKSSS